jgi:hypothetical protein
VVGAGLAAVLVLAGCTGSGATRDLDDPATPMTPAFSGGAGVSAARGTTSARPPAGGRDLGVTPQARIRLPAGMHVVGLTLAGSRLAWSGCLPCAGTAQDATDVYVVDLPAGRVRSVARTRFRWGSTSVIGLVGDALVWLDAADVRDGEALRSRWALRALDLTSRRSWTIAEGGRPGDPAQEPFAFVAGARVTWQLYDAPTGGGPVSSADLRTHAVRLVSHRVPGLLRAVTASGLVYTASHRDARSEGDELVPFDAYLLPARGGEATEVTTGHDVAEATADDERVVWSTAHGDAASLWSRSISGAGPVVLFPGPVVGFVAGRGFAAWTTREAEPVVEVGNGGTPLALPDVPADGGLLAADRDRLALLTVPDRGLSGPLGLVVTRVSARS